MTLEGNTTDVNKEEIGPFFSESEAHFEHALRIQRAQLPLLNANGTRANVCQCLTNNTTGRQTLSIVSMDSVGTVLTVFYDPASFQSLEIFANSILQMIEEAKTHNNNLQTC